MGEEIQLKEHMPSETQIKITSGETFAHQLQKNNAKKSKLAFSFQNQTGGKDQKENLIGSNRNQEKNQASKRNFTDADKDGKCDNLGTDKTPQPKLNGTGSKARGLKNFVDADKDGKCDNLATGKTPQPKLDGTGSKARGHKNFVDVDKDGKCDNLGKDKTPQPKLDGTGSKARGHKNFVDVDKDGKCDNLGKDKTPQPKLDGTGSQSGKGYKGAGKRK